VQRNFSAVHDVSCNDRRSEAKKKLSGVKGIGLKLGLAAQVRTIPEQRAQSLAAQPSLLNPEAAL
jgi:hypothetical protein